MKAALFIETSTTTVELDPDSAANLGDYAAFLTAFAAWEGADLSEGYQFSDADGRVLVRFAEVRGIQLDVEVAR